MLFVNIPNILGKTRTRRLSFHGECVHSCENGLHLAILMKMTSMQRQQGLISNEKFQRKAISYTYQNCDQILLSYVKRSSTKGSISTKSLTSLK